VEIADRIADGPRCRWATRWRGQLGFGPGPYDKLAEPTVRPRLALDGARLGTELKYPRRGMTAEIAGEVFRLSTGADDHGRYFAVEDLARLERLVAEEVIDSGVLVLLTNVANVWTPPASQRRVLYDAFRVHDGHVLGEKVHPYLELKAFDLQRVAAGDRREVRFTIQSTHTIRRADAAQVTRMEIWGPAGITVEDVDAVAIPDEHDARAEPHESEPGT